MSIKVIAFDADDTLWVNEPYFRTSEDAFVAMFSEYLTPHDTVRELFKIQIANLPLYGYGIKGMVLSMIEAGLHITNNNLSAEAVGRIMEFGKGMLNQTIELLDGVEQVLLALQPHYRLVVATKGDLLDQERKLKRSGLAHYFHHIEIMSEKDDAAYLKLIRHLDVQPSELLMVGNSLKSDVMPVLNVGGHAIHVPYHVTWAHEVIEGEIDHPNFRSAERIGEIVEWLV